MILLITTDHCQYLQKHTEQTYPEGCCGLLFGIHQSLEGAIISVIREVYPTPNVWDLVQEKRLQKASRKGFHENYHIRP
jgi:proteasome lid subunit RPN8/RPN11